MQRCTFISMAIRTVFALLFVSFCGVLPLAAQQVMLKGMVTDPQGNALAQATVQLLRENRVLAQVLSDPYGRFRIKTVPAGKYVFRVEASGFQSKMQPVTVLPGNNAEFKLRISQLASEVSSVTVTADVNDFDVLSPDPGEKVFVRQDLLDANPGRPGAPVSIPGYPIETASSGIKAPQYFAPGVAGDHGEPIAQYIAVGSYLVPNNLSANAHGNGYADPNIFIPEVLESVQVDGGAFNARQGNHAVNLAAIYGLRSSLDPFLTFTADQRDIDLVAGLSPTPASFVAIEASYGNGFLKRLEHRQQYKINTRRVFDLGPHRLTLLGIGYFGISRIPGLIPIFPEDANDANFPNYGDTIDPRQRDQTHTALVAFNDSWRLTGMQQLFFSGFFRTYNLALLSDFGAGLIRQSEFRTVAGGSINYVNKFSEAASLIGGFDYNREAPRRDNLDQYGYPEPQNLSFYGVFHKVDSNNVTIGSYTPYGALSGALSRYFRYYAGWRRDEIEVTNNDLIHAGNSFQKVTGLNGPKATVSFLPKDAWYVPLISLSYGQAFFTEDPRIGAGAGPGTPVATAHSYQLVVSKTVVQTDFKLILGHVTTSSALAKINPDTGFQLDQGPARNQFVTVAIRHTFSQGSILATFSKADARDLQSGQPTPEAPRTIFDLLGNAHKLPFRLQARAEFEYVGLKPLGSGCYPDPNAQCTGTPVKEFRAALVRPFAEERFDVGVNMFFASGYTGQTIESFDPSNVQEVVGVRIPSYASVNVTYRFGRSMAPSTSTV